MANRNWGEIPTDLATKIAEHVQLYEDFESFGHVCSQWRLAAKEATFGAAMNLSICLRHHHVPHRVPWIMLPELYHSSHQRRFHCLCQSHLDLNVYRVCLASPTCLLSSRGWLLCFSGIDCNLSLFNPFSGSVIELPPVPQCYSIGITPVISYDKFILSADPATTSDYAVAVIFSDPYLYFSCSEYKVLIWWNGDTNWVRVADRITNTVFRHLCHDLAFYKGELYGVDGSGQVVCLGSSKSGEEIPRILANVRFFVNDWRVDLSMYYLVDSEVDDRLLVIYRCVNVLYVKDYVEVVNPLDGTRFVFEKTSKDDKDVNTQFFRVFEVDVKTGEVEQIHSLGNRAVFLGMNSSFSVEAAPAHGCKPNCIYFTDTHVSIYNFRYLNKGQDVGIYNFTDNKFEDYHYHGFSYSADVATPPIWVQPPI